MDKLIGIQFRKLMLGYEVSLLLDTQFCGLMSFHSLAMCQGVHHNLNFQGY
jgi:hypothetical protein